ncbi:MAG: Fic family protein [Microscillaceae bacterium]|jgi:Fic family protein|nr:Fic family protein [Microscillaceae bacterium]
MNQLSQKFQQYILQSPDNQIRKDLLRLYHSTESLAKLLEQIDDLKKCLDSLRPLSQRQLEILEKALSVEFAYHSNRIEGNTLTLSETAIVIQEGMTIHGKSLREHNEAINHDFAYQYIKKIVEQKQELTENVICTIHETILKNIIPEEAGIYRRVAVRITGTTYTPPNYLKVPQLMADMLDYYELNKNTLHPILLATYMHERILSIHPFVDGNGRTARLVYNLILLANGFPLAIVKGDKRTIKSYYLALKQAQLNQNLQYLNLFLGRNVKNALIEYLNLLGASASESGKGEYLINKILN